MADHEMSAEELASLYFAPSAEAGPEAAPLCVICGERRVESEYRQRTSGVCPTCEHEQAWRPDPGPRPRPKPRLMPQAIQAHVNYENKALYQARQAYAPQSPRPAPIPPGYYPTSFVNERAVKEWCKGAVFGVIMGVLASALWGMFRDRRRT